MRAARVAMRDEIANDTLYHWRAGSEGEAAYLVALLNAPALGQAFVDARRSGRDFHTHFWGKVPIPRYDKNNVRMFQRRVLDFSCGDFRDGHGAADRIGWSPLTLWTFRHDYRRAGSGRDIVVVTTSFIGDSLPHYCARGRYNTSTSSLCPYRVKPIRMASGHMSGNASREGGRFSN